MLDLETLRAVKTLLIHGGACPDGIASAILLHDALPQAKVRFIQYNSEEHHKLEPGPNMLFADFTPKEKNVQGFLDAGAIVLDHHKGVQDLVAKFGDNGRFGDEETEPGVCGAVLCYRHVWLLEATSRPEHEHRSARDLAVLAGIRDTWQRQDQRWVDACAQAEMLRFYPENYWLDLERPFSDRHADLWAERRRVGRILVEKHARAVKAVLEKSWRFTSLKGTRVVVFDGTSKSSDAADIADGADLVIGFGYTVEGGIQKTLFSCRTRNNYDCLSLAQAFGGGGHSGAAGFNRPVNDLSVNPFQHAELLVNEHEGRTQKCEGSLGEEASS